MAFIKKYSLDNLNNQDDVSSWHSYSSNTASSLISNMTLDNDYEKNSISSEQIGTKKRLVIKSPDGTYKFGKK